LAEAIVLPFFPEPAADVPLTGHRVSGRIHEDRLEARVVVRVAMHQEKARLCGDGDADLFGELEAAAPLEVLLGDEYLHVAEQLSLVRRAEMPEDGQVALGDGAPFRRRRCSAEPRSPALREEAKDHQG